METKIGHYYSKSVILQVQLYLMCWLRGRASPGLRDVYSFLCLDSGVIILPWLPVFIHSE